MKNLINNLITKIESVKANKNFNVNFFQLEKGYPLNELEELLEGLELQLPENLIDFYTEIGGLSFVWNIVPEAVKDKVPEEDLGYLTGSIQLMNPFDMVMGKSGKRWKNVIWFDNSENSEKKKLQNFLPFDFPSTELAAGFENDKNKILDKMSLFSSNDGLSFTELSLSDYLNNLIETAGFSYWQHFNQGYESDAERCYKQYMSLLF